MVGGSINQVARANHRGSYMGALHWHAEAIPNFNLEDKVIFNGGGNVNKKGGHMGRKWELG